MRNDELAVYRTSIWRVIAGSDGSLQHFRLLLYIFSIVACALVVRATSPCALAPPSQVHPPSGQVDTRFLTRNHLSMGVILRSQTSYTNMGPVQR